MKITIFFLFIVLSAFTLNAQHDIQSSMYPDNKFLLNPANAGDKDLAPFVFIGYRYDFAGMAGALRRPMIAMHSPVSSNIGLGGLLSYEQNGIFQYVNIAGSYSYLVEFSKYNSLRLGISTGVYFRDINYSKVKVNVQSDALLNQGYYSDVFFFSGLGFEWQVNDFFVNASLPKLYSAEDKTFIASAAGGLGYKIELNKSSITPSVFAHYWKNNPVRIDFNLVYKMPEKFFILTSFKSDISASLGAGVNINDLNVSYVFDYQNQLWPEAKGCHEVIISYSFSQIQFSKGRKYK